MLDEDRKTHSAEGIMIIILALILAIIVLDITAVRWGKDSTEGPGSKEWEYRKHQIGL